MSRGPRFTPDQMKKLGMVEKDGMYVKAESLVAKGPVKKIEPSVTEYQQREIDRVNKRKEKDAEIALGMALKTHQMSVGFDPIDAINKAVRTYIKDDKLLHELIDISKFYATQIPAEKRTVKIKPMSVNSCWQGKRFKTPRYDKYAEAVSLLLPNDLIIPEGLLKVYYEFGLSNSSADWDNPCKPFQDILQAKYGFNDSRIMEAHIKKVIVKKGQEYISFRIESL